MNFPLILASPPLPGPPPKEASLTVVESPTRARKRSSERIARALIRRTATWGVLVLEGEGEGGGRREREEGGVTVD